MKKLMFLLGISLIALGSINAQTSRKEGKKKWVKHNKRIHPGNKDGSLTRRELKQLKNQKRNIKQTVRMVHADGVVTNRERRIVARKNKNLSRNIYKKRHNERV